MLVLEIAVPGARIAAQATPSDPIEMLKPYAASAAQAPLGDYVPCLFDDGERRNLRALPSVGQKVTLDGQAAQALITLTQNDVNAQIPQPIATKDKSAPAPTAEQGSAAEFTGKLPAEAQKLGGRKASYHRRASPLEDPGFADRTQRLPTTARCQLLIFDHAVGRD
jgi:hypothetical protein